MIDISLEAGLRELATSERDMAKHAAARLDNDAVPGYLCNAEFFDAVLRRLSQLKKNLKVAKVLASYGLNMEYLDFDKLYDLDYLQKWFGAEGLPGYVWNEIKTAQTGEAE